MGKKILSALLKVRDLFEVVIPCITFCACLLSFVLQIFFRYVMRNPLSWTMEVCSITFTWTVLFGACYAMRTKGHVYFTMFYDMYPAKLKAAASLFGELLMLVCFTASVIPTARYVSFMAISKSSVLQISMSYIYAPYMVFLIMNIFYIALDAIRSFRALAGGGEAMEEMLHDNQAEWKTVIEQADAQRAEAEQEAHDQKGGTQ